MTFETIRAIADRGVVFATIAAPPMNLLGPELVRDLVALIQQAEADPEAQVLVIRSADRDYFLSHVDVTRLAEFRDAAKLDGNDSLGLLFRHLSASRVVTIAQIEGRVRGAGTELALACDMRFAARETAIIGQPEAGFGMVPGSGGMQHLTRLLGRGRAFEVMLSGDDYTADLAERYGLINRALPVVDLAAFVSRLAYRIAAFPAGARTIIKDRINELSLAPAAEVRRDTELFVERARAPETQSRVHAAMQLGLQTREGEMALARMLPKLEPQR